MFSMSAYNIALQVHTHQHIQDKNNSQWTGLNIKIKKSEKIKVNTVYETE